MTLSIFGAAQDAPDRAAIVQGANAITFRQLAEHSRAALQWLTQRRVGQPCRPGALHALVARPDVNTVAMLLALFAEGSPVVLVHPRWGIEERAAALAGFGDMTEVPEGWADEHSTHSALIDPPAIEDDDRPLAILFTSGSAGKPKGVELSRAAFAAAAAASAARLGWQEHDRWLLGLPFAHVGGLSIITRCLLARTTLVLPPDASGFTSLRELAAYVDSSAVTLLSLVPTQLAALLELEPSWRLPAAVRAILLGGAPASPPLLRTASVRGWPVLATYGLTEACSQVATQSPGTSNDGRLGCGTPLPGMDIRIIDGVIHVKGPSLFTRYLPSGDAPHRAAGGWFQTGDLGRLDDAGHLHPLGRRDDIIITGGEKVMPQEVESTLLDCPGVAEACVFGIRDAKWGQVVSVAVVPRETEWDAPRFLAFMTSRLAPYKRPRRVAYLSALPRLPNGKVDRESLVRVPTAELRAPQRP